MSISNAQRLHGGPIAESHLRSLNAFTHLCDKAREHRDLLWSQRLIEECDRYQLWAGNLGAGNPRFKLSLDYRDQVLNLLKILRRHVGRVLHSLGESELSDRLCWESDDPEELTSGEDSDDSSIEIASDPEGEAQSKDSQESTSQELELLSESIKLTVSCLYQLPIRKPAPVDRLRDKSTGEMQYYEHFDTIYVMDKFPLLDQRVAARLGNLVTRRRRLLRYRESHARHLKGSRSTGGQHIFKRTAQTGRASSLRIGPESVTEQSSRTGASKSEATKLVLGKMQSHLDNDLAALSNADAESTTSDFASEFTEESPVEIPPRPRNEKGQPMTSFECAYCRLLVFKHTEKDWKKHVLEDLQPYVCTFAECELSEHLFESRNAWFNHETQRHRVEFSCNVAGHEVYRTRAGFIEHLSQVHGTTTQVASTLPELFRRPSKDLTTRCNLCGRITQQLKAHVSRHLQHIALFAVPRIHYQSDIDADEIDSNLAQQLTNPASQKDLQDGSLYSDSEVDAAAEMSTKGPEWEQFLTWLSPEDYWETHQKLSHQAIKGIRQSFFEKDQFVSWMKMEARYLWCFGGAGTGKTLLASTIINKIIDSARDLGGEARIGVTFLYLTYKSPRSLNQLLGGLARQLVVRYCASGGLSSVKELWSSAAQNDFEVPPDLQQLDRLLLDLTSITNTFIVIDALDEVTDPSQRRDLLDHLRKLGNANLLIMSQYFDGSDDASQDFEIVGSEFEKDDQHRWIDHKITTNAQLKEMVQQQPGLATKMKKLVSDKCAGVFQIAHLIIDRFEQELLPTDTGKPSAGLSEEQEEAYTNALRQIFDSEDPGRHWALWTLSALYIARKPVPMDTLRRPLSMQENIFYPPKSFDQGRLLKEEDLETFCFGLVSKQNDRLGLTPDSLFEYFDTRKMDKPFPDFHFQMSEALGHDKAVLDMERGIDADIYKPQDGDLSSGGLEGAVPAAEHPKERGPDS
ncbi:hypothetical protein IWZ00DRAFT_508615 [Phyllosticta capitalensis]